MPINTQVVVPAQVKLPGSSLSADEISAALDAGSGTAAQVVRGDGSISALAAEDIPATLNATTFGGDLTLTASYGVYKNSNAALLILNGGSGAGQAYGSQISLYGNSHTTKPGDAEYYTGSASGAAHSFFDKNGVEQLRINEAGLIFPGTSTLGPAIFSGTGGYCSVGQWFYPSISAFFGHNSHFPVIQGYLATRLASTAIAICPVATGDTAEVEIHETTIAGCKAFVDAAGTVTLYSPIYGTVSASIVNSSSPAAGEYGVYISAGVLYFKGGSSYAGKMASFSKIGKA